MRSGLFGGVGLFSVCEGGDGFSHGVGRAGGSCRAGGREGGRELREGGRALFVPVLVICPHVSFVLASFAG